MTPTETRCVVVVALAVVVLLLNAGLIYGHTVMRGECRVDIERTRNFTSMNISCYCERGEDVVARLKQVEGAKYSWKPTTADLKVDSATLHIVGCRVRAEPLPSSILDLVRRTDYLELYVKDSPQLRLSPYILGNYTVPELKATFINSNLSGIPEGVLGGVSSLKVLMEECEVGVVESRAFSGYPQRGNVSITFLKTTIFTLKMVSFKLPPASEVAIIGGHVMSWDRSGYAGGANLSLQGVRITRLLSHAINLYGLHSFIMTGCSVAELYNEALDYRKLHHGWEIKNNTAVLTDNTFIKASGESFINLCFVTELVWKMNTFANLTTPPLRLQSPECTRKRDWGKVVARTDLNCLNCDDFRNPDEQSCAVYTSGVCVNCEGQGQLDSCNKPILPYLVHGPCRESHSSVMTALRTTCGYGAAGGTRSPRKLNVGGGAVLVPSVVVMAVAVVVALGTVVV